MPPDLEIEHRHRRAGSRIIAGVDEAGRGPLAGPVFAAAVVLPEDFTHPELNDSKKLTPARRERVYEQLRADTSLRVSCASASVEEIDKLNILRATHLAMRRAVEGLGVPPCVVLVDGLPVSGFPWPQEAVVKGDSLSLSIAAASVIAKVERDRAMLACDAEFPGYGFAVHKGYGTRAHLEALRLLGPCPIHRKSFQPVAQLSLEL